MKRPRKKKPHYSAKPGQSETTQAKEYGKITSAKEKCFEKEDIRKELINQYDKLYS